MREKSFFFVFFLFSNTRQKLKKARPQTKTQKKKKNKKKKKISPKKKNKKKKKKKKKKNRHIHSFNHWVLGFGWGDYDGKNASLLNLKDPPYRDVSMGEFQFFFLSLSAVRRSKK